MKNLNISNFSKFGTPNRINQAAQVIYKSLLNTVESFGLPLPVLVTETLTFADGEYFQFITHTMIILKHENLKIAFSTFS